jgi:hypothetical protein
MNYPLGLFLLFDRQFFTIPRDIVIMLVRGNGWATLNGVSWVMSWRAGLGLCLGGDVGVRPITTSGRIECSEFGEFSFGKFLLVSSVRRLLKEEKRKSKKERKRLKETE